MDFKRILRIILLAFLLALALCGIGVVPPRPSRDDNEIKIELVEDRNEDDDTSSEVEDEKKS
jgi:hypothetical protein